jgi:uncharacterized protein DUF6220
MEARSMVRSFARQALPIAAGLFVACAVIQVFLAGLGVFDDPRYFLTHAGFGYTFGWLTLIVLVLSLLGREPRRIVGLSILLLALFSLQSVFVALRESYPAVAALHPLNGFLILGVAIVLTRASWAVRREPAVIGAPGAADPTVAQAPGAG